MIKNWAILQENENHEWIFITVETSYYTSNLIKEYIKSGWSATVDERHLEYLSLDAETISKINIVNNKIEILYKDENKNSCYVVWLLYSEDPIISLPNILSIEDTDLD
jgi:hypothetical protein